MTLYPSELGVLGVHSGHMPQVLTLLIITGVLKYLKLNLIVAMKNHCALSYSPPTIPRGVPCVNPYF